MKKKNRQGYWSMSGWKGKLFRFFAYKGLYQTNWFVRSIKKKLDNVVRLCNN